jgi:DNA-binding NtrC family response regulator
VVQARPWIVVFDKHPPARAALAELLRDDGFSVEECQCADDVLAAARTGRRIHCLLVDVGPGRLLVDEVRRYQPDVRILFMSGQDALPEGLVGELLEKPIDIDALERLLRGAAEQPAARTGSH